MAMLYWAATVSPGLTRSKVQVIIAVIDLKGNLASSSESPMEMVTSWAVVSLLLRKLTPKSMTLG